MTDLPLLSSRSKTIRKAPQVEVGRAFGRVRFATKDPGKNQWPSRAPRIT